VQVLVRRVRIVNIASIVKRIKELVEFAKNKLWFHFSANCSLQRKYNI
jgi:hypothetical protein